MEIYLLVNGEILVPCLYVNLPPIFVSHIYVTSVNKVYHINVTFGISLYFKTYTYAVLFISFYIESMLIKECFCLLKNFLFEPFISSLQKTTSRIICKQFVDIYVIDYIDNEDTIKSSTAFCIVHHVIHNIGFPAPIGMRKESVKQFTFVCKIKVIQLLFYISHNNMLVFV